MNDFIKQEIKNFIASIKRRSIRASGNVQDFTKIFGKSGPIFGLVKQVRIDHEGRAILPGSSYLHINRQIGLLNL